MTIMAQKDSFKLQPTELNLVFATPTTTSGTWYIDIARALSAVNRRFYRQGYQYAVADIQFLSGGTGSVVVKRLPTTWTVANSWMKVMAGWDKQQKQALEDAGAQSAKAKFRDFKVALNRDHSINWQLADSPGTPVVTTGVLQPLDSNSTAYQAGEWEPSVVQVPDDTAPGVTGTYQLHMCETNSATSKGMILAYQLSRARVSEDDQPPSGDPETGLLAEMFNRSDSDDEAIAAATDRNDNAPYNVFNYPGGASNGPGLAVHDYVNIVQQSAPGGAGIQTAYARGGVFPCGLMAITWTPDESSNLALVVRLVPGTYRGVHAEHMKEM